jgi:hypothetical protein
MWRRDAENNRQVVVDYGKSRWQMTGKLTQQAPQRSTDEDYSMFMQPGSFCIK